MTNLTIPNLKTTLKNDISLLKRFSASLHMYDKDIFHIKIQILMRLNYLNTVFLLKYDLKKKIK